MGINMGEKSEKLKRSVVAYTTETDVMKAFEEVCSTIDEAAQGRVPILIILLSGIESFALISKKLNDKYKGACIIGSTTNVTYGSKGDSEEGVNIVAVFKGVQCFSGVLLDVKSYPSRYIDNITNAVDKLKDYENVVCFQFTTAFSNCEELVQDTYRSALLSKNIPIFGGTAGGSYTNEESYVSLNGVIYDEASVFVFIKNLNGGFHIFKENIFRPINHTYTATDVDVDERVVYEFNNRPAAQVVAESLHVSVEELPDRINMHPVGRIEGDRIYITEADRVNPDLSITFFSRIYNFTEVIQLEPDDVHEVWDSTKRDIEEKMKQQEFSIVVNCIVRTNYFKSRELWDEFNGFLKGSLTNYIGLTGFGENVEFQHLNSTMIILTFE